ncbi:MAG TPA: ABC transporter substrate-binding protein [Acidimicrobiales bacterium]|jgi:sulfonate transport system substrate-binding protein
MTTAQEISTLSNRSSRKIIGSLLMAALIVSSIVWFGGRAQASSTGKTATKIPAGTVLNIGDQEQFLESALEDSGALKGAPYKVNFVEFDSGPLVDAGFAAHQIDVGYMGDLPAALAVQSGLPVKAVAAFLSLGASEFLLAKPGITSIAQLKGQPVAFTTGTAEQAFALRALASAGLSQKDVTQVNVALQQLGTVLQTGAAVASVVTVEQKVEYEQTNPGATVLATQQTVKPASYDYLLGTTAALDNKAKDAAINDLTVRLIKAENWVKTHESTYVNDYYVNLLHLSTTDAKLILAAGGTFKYVPLNGSETNALQNVVDLLANADAIPKSFKVGALFSPAVSKQYNAIIKANVQVNN